MKFLIMYIIFGYSIVSARGDSTSSETEDKDNVYTKESNTPHTDFELNGMGPIEDRGFYCDLNLQNDDSLERDLNNSTWRILFLDSCVVIGMIIALFVCLIILKVSFPF